VTEAEHLAEGQSDPAQPSFVQIGPEDLKQLAPLWESMRAYYGSIAPDLPRYGSAESWARRAREYLELLEDGGMILGLRCEDRLLAYAATRPSKSSTVFAWSEHTTEVETFVVEPSARGRGYGHLLLNQVRLELGRRGNDEIVLHVLATNDAALRFYRSAGFSPYLVMLSDAIPAAD
jgi:ribosomal protein S18 acetylase RimI-like enzyme